MYTVVSVQTEKEKWRSERATQRAPNGLGHGIRLKVDGAHYVASLAWTF